MTKELSVDEQTLQRKTRHRLMGAAAFTLLMVVALPMLLDGEPKSTSQNISLDIPPPDNPPAFVPQPAPSAVAPAVEMTAPPLAADPAAPAVEPPQPTPIEAALPPATEAPAPVITKPSAPKPLVVIPPLGSDGSGERYVLQVGNYSNPKMADHVVEKLRANYLKVSTEKSGNLTRIQVGPFADKAQAEKARQLLLKQGTRTSLMAIK